MTVRGRGLAAAAFVIGVALGGVDAVRPSHRPFERGGYTVVAADFHVHSFPDGLPPWEAAREARRRRLDVIALTSHNSLFSWWLWQRALWVPEDARGVIVLPGEELTAVGYHLALVGISSAVPWRQPLAQAAAAAQAQGGAAILAHPKKDLALPQGDEALRALDGIEVAHPGMDVDDEIRRDFADAYQRTLRARGGIVAAIGSSDFHYFKEIGYCRTYVFCRSADAPGIVEAIRAGRTIACDARGQAYGPPELMRLVADDCARDAVAPPDDDRLLARSGAVLAWVGLAALVVMGAAGD